MKMPMNMACNEDANDSGMKWRCHGCNMEWWCYWILRETKMLMSMVWNEDDFEDGMKLPF